MRTISNTYAQVALAQSCANHVQHTECLSRATCRVTCHVLRRDNSAIKFNRVEITFILTLFYWLNAGRKAEYPEKTPGDELQKMPHTTARRFKPKARLEPRSSIVGGLGKQTCKPLHHASPHQQMMLLRLTVCCLFSDPSSGGLRDSSAQIC